MSHSGRSAQCTIRIQAPGAIAVAQIHTHVAGDSKGEGWHLQVWSACVHSAATCRRSAILACKPSISLSCQLAAFGLLVLYVSLHIGPALVPCLSLSLMAFCLPAALLVQHALSPAISIHKVEIEMAVACVADVYLWLHCLRQ